MEPQDSNAKKSCARDGADRNNLRYKLCGGVGGERLGVEMRICHQRGRGRGKRKWARYLGGRKGANQALAVITPKDSSVRPCTTSNDGTCVG